MSYALKFVDHKQESTDEQNFIMFGFVAPKLYVNVLFMAFLLLWMASTGVFMDKFIIKITNPTDCPTKANNWLYSCYPGSNVNTSLFDDNVNCSDREYLDSLNITNFQCYQFVFDYVDAAAAATGMFTVSAGPSWHSSSGLFSIVQGEEPVSKYLAQENQQPFSLHSFLPL